MSDALDVLKERGFFKQCTDETGLRTKLAEGPKKFYIGVDPTGPSCHIGHLVPIYASAHLQKAGHKPIILMGGGTAGGGPGGDTAGDSGSRDAVASTDAGGTDATAAIDAGTTHGGMDASMDSAHGSDSATSMDAGVDAIAVSDAMADAVVDGRNASEVRLGEGLDGRFDIGVRLAEHSEVARALRVRREELGEVGVADIAWLDHRHLDRVAVAANPVLAGEAGFAVHHHSAASADRHSTGHSVGEGRIQVVLDVHQRVENLPVLVLDGHLVALGLRHLIHVGIETGHNDRLLLCTHLSTCAPRAPIFRA